MSRATIRLFGFGIVMLSIGLGLARCQPQLRQPAARLIFPAPSELKATLLYPGSNAYRRLNIQLYKAVHNASFIETALRTTHPAALKTVTPQQIKVWARFYERRDELDVCSTSGGDNFFWQSWYPNLYKIDNGFYLIEQFCAIGRNSSIQYFLSKQITQFSPVLFEQIDTEKVQKREIDASDITLVSSISGLRTYDPDSQTLQAFTKTRGSGNCGDFQKYRLDSSAQKFILLEYRLQLDCTAVFVEPSEYEIIYQRE
ncbi:MAG: hypothetical protein F6J87_03650 [Spirulina sp. SIO3F2]|nr:hypothetical protein [Spirulina sp. SIO3F2]